MTAPHERRPTPTDRPRRSHRQRQDRARLALARALNGEIVSCDSVAVYRLMDIGSAKPSPAEQGARVPHHCLDLYWPKRTMHRRLAGPAAPALAIADIQSRSPPPHHRRWNRPLPPRSPRRPRPCAPARRNPPRHTASAHPVRGPASSHRLLQRLDPTAAHAPSTPTTCPSSSAASKSRSPPAPPPNRAMANRPRRPLTGYNILPPWPLAGPRTAL